MSDTAPAAAVIAAPAHPLVKALRTVLVALPLVLALLPVMVEQFGLATYPWAAGILAAVGGLTRLLNTPQAEAILRRIAPKMAANDVEAARVVAAVTPEGTVVAGEAHRAETGTELTGSIVTNTAAPPAKRKRKPRKGA